jgi:hypothetical protein
VPERSQSAARDHTLTTPPDFIASPLHCFVIRRFIQHCRFRRLQSGWRSHDGQPLRHKI